MFSSPRRSILTDSLTELNERVGAGRVEQSTSGLQGQTIIKYFWEGGGILKINLQKFCNFFMHFLVCLFFLCCENSNLIICKCH